jgi:N-acyl-D-amino-acid deacylase
MEQLVRAAIADGACGASSGLEYTPGAFAPLDELIALCKPLAAKRLPYATHMRNEDDKLIEAIDEAIAVARGAGCPLQICHLKTQGPRNWNKLDTAFARVAAARAAGCDAAFDRYPYIAYQTGLTNLFPVWSRDGSTAAFLARLGDSSVGPRIKQETLAKVELIGGWDNVMIANVSNAADKPAEGARLGTYVGQSMPVDMAVAPSAKPWQCRHGRLRDERGESRSHSRASYGWSAATVVRSRPTAARQGHPHPRGSERSRGFSRYVRGEKRSRCRRRSTR